MKTLLLNLLILLLVVWCEGIFFNPHRKSIWDLFSKGKDRKKANVHHFHIHYYPLPLKISEPPLVAPEEKTLDQMHDEKLRSLGWSDDEFSVPDPKIIYPSQLDNIWKEEHKSPYSWSGSVFESHPPKDTSNLLLQLPLHQQFIFQLPKEKEESSFLGSLLQKIQTFKKFLFSGSSSQHEEYGWEDRVDQKPLSNDLNDYLYYINQEDGKES